MISFEEMTKAAEMSDEDDERDCIINKARVALMHSSSFTTNQLKTEKLNSQSSINRKFPPITKVIGF